MSFVLNFLPKLDIFSPNYSLEYNSSNKHSSKTGGVYSIIAFLLTVIYSLYFMIPILQKKTSTFLTYDQYLNNSTIQFNSYPIFFNFANIKSVSTEYIDLFDIVISKIIVDSSGNFSSIAYYQNDILKKCDQVNYIDNKGDYLNTIRGIYCLDHKNLTIENVINSINSTYIYITFSVCDPIKNKKCPSNIDDLVSNIYIIINYLQPNIITENYQKPINYQSDSHRIKLDRNLIKRLTFKFIYGLFISDNGLFNIEEYTTDYITMYQKELDYFTANTKLTREIFTLELSSSRLGRYYKRFYPKILDGLSQIGGVISFIISFINILSQYHLRIEYLVFINNMINNNENKKHSRLMTTTNSPIKKINYIEKENLSKINDIHHLNKLKIIKNIEKTKNLHENTNEVSSSLSLYEEIKLIFFCNFNKYKKLKINKRLISQYISFEHMLRMIKMKIDKEGTNLKKEILKKEK